MKYLWQFLIILFISFLGEVLNHFIPLPIPASIYGILILLGCLSLKIIKVSDVDSISRFLIEIMPIMFIPAAVGLVNSFDIISESIIEIIIIIITSTIFVMICAGLTSKLILRLKNKRKVENDEGIFE